MVEVKIHGKALVERRRKPEAHTHNERIHHLAVFNEQVRKECYGAEPARIRPEHPDILHRGRFAQALDRIQKASHHKADSHNDALGQYLLEDSKAHKRSKDRVQHHHGLHLR